jgi:hypothetical protein
MKHLLTLLATASVALAVAAASGSSDIPHARTFRSRYA